MGDSLTAALVPAYVEDDCVQQRLDCEGEVVSAIPSGDVEVIFPEFLNGVLPLSGGSIVSVNIGGETIEEDPEVASLIEKKISFLSEFTFTNSLESLTEFRIAVNKELLRLKEFKLKIGEGKKNSPKIYLSYLDGDDSHLIDTLSSSTVTRVCKFKYIPFSFFKAVLDAVVPVLESEDDFGWAVGIAGETFRELLLGFVEAPTEDKVVDLVLEFFTIYNISEDDLRNSLGAPVSGGFYTILKDKAYIKMPDITGKDSSGYYSDIFSEDTNFYIEISKGRKIFKRGKIDSFSAPILATVDDGNLVLPDSGDFVITLDTSFSAGDIKDAYLSIISVDGNIDSESRAIEVFQDKAELFSIPLLTDNGLFPASKNRKPTLQLSSNDLLLLENDLDKYFGGTANKFSKKFSILDLIPEDSGVPFLGEINGERFFGEKNRPDIGLSDTSKGRSVRKNDRRYFSPKAYGTIPLLSSVRPRLYSKVPQMWISMSGASDNGDGAVELSFKAADFDNINFDALGSEVSFALYLKGSNGQISRVAGENITLTRELPSITGISPNGYVGSDEVLAESEGVTFRLTGSSLSFATGMKITRKGSTDGLITDFISSLVRYVPGKETSTIKVIGELSSVGLEAGLEYRLSLIGTSGRVGDDVGIFVNSAKGEDQISEPKEILTFQDNDFEVKKFKTRAFSGVPILTEDDASIYLKSKRKLFSGKYDIFAYIGVDDKNVANAISGDDVLTSTIDGKAVYIPLGVQYEFTKAFDQDFSRNFFNNSAILKIPGKGNSKVNLYPLIKTSSCSLIFYNKPIREDIDQNGNFTFEEGNFFDIKIGNSENKPFILPPSVAGLVADLPGPDTPISTFSAGTSDENIIEEFGVQPTVGSISVFQKIPKIAIIFNGIDSGNLISEYSFFIGEKSIDRYMSRKISPLQNGKLMAVFKNVSISEEGNLEVRIEKKDKTFKYDFSSTIQNKRASFPISVDAFEKEKDGTLTLTGDAKDWYTEGILSDEGLELDLLIPDGTSGALTNPALSTGTLHSFYSPLSIVPNLSTRILENSAEGTTLLLKNVTTEVSELIRLSLRIPAGESLAIDSYHQNGEGNAVGFLNWSLTGGATIECNIPKIIGIKTSVEAQNFTLIEKVKGHLLKPGNEIKLLVTNTKKDFKIIFNELFPAKIKGRARKISTGRYEVTVLIPSTLKTSDCVDICASIANSKRLGAKVRLGETYVRKLVQNVSRKLFGNVKERIPDVEELKGLIEDFPLRFVNVELDKSLVPTDLINSFCDFSWHLTADLKVALNGFQVLLIPIQVILCIIDVICSLMNPKKLALAIIRLFFCIYDLLLLIPQISVPVMFLQLIIHLIKLLECVLLKVIETITSINEIIKAMELAKSGEHWGALQALEEILSEYLFELNVDLQVLEPVITILAIFIQLLSLVFNLPCPPDEESDKSCGLQGTMLAGLISEKIAPGGGEYDPSVLLPIVQYFTEDEIDERIAANAGSTYETWTLGDEIIDRGTESNFYDAMNIDLDTLRTSNGTDFEASFGCSFTKSSKGLGNPALVKFKFNDKLDNSGFFGKKILDPLLNRDAPIHLLEDDSGTLIVSTGKGNFISPIDGALFISIDGDKGSVLPLVLDFEVPITELNEESGELEQTGTEIVTRTFDDVPKMALMDENSNLYFIEPDGISFDSDNSIESITAKVVNLSSAEKEKFSRDDQENDAGDEGRVYDLPQLFFVDMRVIADELQDACYASSFNEFLFDGEDTDDIAQIIEESQECIEEYQTFIQSKISTIRDSLSNGEVPTPINLSDIAKAHSDLTDCLEDKADAMCRFVINPLNTSFLIEEDEDFTPRGDFPDEIYDPTNSLELDVVQTGPSFTGAREYAGGIGDSVVVGIGEVATIRVTPRDSYDLEVNGEFGEKILLKIASDSTGSAKFIPYPDGALFEKIGNDYIFKLIANDAGEVKLTGSICSRTIQAITFAGVELTSEEPEIDCVPDVTEDESSIIRPGALSKVDRILTVHYIRKAKVVLGDADGTKLANTTPQVFGTNLEN